MEHDDWDRRTARVSLLLLGLLLGPGAAIAGAEDDAAASGVAPPAPGRPVVTVLGGLGSSYGGFGAQVEYYLGSRRFSFYGGVGYYPGGDDDRCPSGLAGAGGARLYTGGVRHRGFLEVALAPIASNFVIQDDELVDQAIVYGPSVHLGYQLVRDGGFTLQASVGVGYGRWSEYDVSVVAFQLGLGIGHSWR